MRLIILLCFLSITSAAQKFAVEKSMVTFYSHATIEDIKADNKDAVSIFDTGTGDIAFSIPIKGFHFDKKLMEEHFNEKYMDTDKFPKSTFQGKMTGYDASATGPQNASATGKLTIHGVIRDVTINGTVEFTGKQVLLKSKFIVILEDYKVDRPQLLWKNIAEQVEVTIDFTMKPYEK